MKITTKISVLWELSDIVAGLVVIKNTSPVGSSDHSFARTVVYTVGYLTDLKGGKYGLMNSLTDGWFYIVGNKKEDVLKHLNDGDFRPLTRNEYITITSDKTQGLLLKSV